MSDGMDTRHILAIDQGTSGTKAVIFDAQGRIAAKATQPLKSYFPRPGFVEQDPLEIYGNVLAAVRACLKEFRQSASGDLSAIAACGISNQRETFVLWDEAGRPLCNAVVWQCKRSVDVCDRLKGSPLESGIRRRTGLIVDPYFSGTKLLWLRENDPRVAKAILESKAFFGTVDTWLLYKLSGGRSFLTDHTNASRTLLFNIDELQWDGHLLDQFGLRGVNLPEPRPSSSDYGVTDFDGTLPRAIPISAMIGDSHAAAFGEGCFSCGAAKATLGTGCSILLNTGSKRIEPAKGTVATICWSVPGRVDYALEGIIVTCGATIVWLRDQLGLFAQSAQTQEMALAVEDNGGVYLIPAFSGLGAPHWKMDLRAAILGLTLGSDKRHIARAALESIPYQIKDVMTVMEQDSGIELRQLKADGGITANRFVMQFLADLLDVEVVNIGIADVSALGAACLAGLQQGIFKSLEQLEQLSVGRQTYRPAPDKENVQRWYGGWQAAVQQLL
jgi:glycerol kinase